MSITLIACTDMNNGIGTGEKLLFNLPKDMKHFKAVTTGKTVVMGRKTWESLPAKPLPKRKNYVLSMDEDFVAEGATVIDSIEAVLELAKNKEVFIIGGSEIYFQTIDDADKLMITHVHTFGNHATRHFPDIDVKQWKLVSVKEHKADKEHAHNFTFATYERKE
ncbi:dihydrofolate reductase [Halobacillus rhizosphaerae]|uniref:dihydrofolate reductase n=1 Tax=Halobacillus rhizosphaerae TaxID=3064889 RepID=UPI00398A87F1